MRCTVFAAASGWNKSRSSLIIAADKQTKKQTNNESVSAKFLFSFDAFSLLSLRRISSFDIRLATSIIRREIEVKKSFERKHWIWERIE